VDESKRVTLRLEIDYTTTQHKSETVIKDAKWLVDEISHLVEQMTNGFVTPTGGAAWDENDEKVEIYETTDGVIQ
jgi:hypothetical protein